MSTAAIDALGTLRAFADTKLVPSKNGPISVKEYLQKASAVDEETIIQPVLFPAFAKAMLGWDLNVDLSAESSGKEGKPDFTPADAVSHPFVFETKGTHKGPELTGDEPQVLRYLRDGAPRIKKVVLTNIIAARIMTLDDKGHLTELYSVNFRDLLYGQLETVAALPTAQRLAQFVSEFSRHDLTGDEKIARVRAAPAWNPAVENTTSEWVLERLDGIVTLLGQKVIDRLRSGVLDDASVIHSSERTRILNELRVLAERLGEASADQRTVDDFVNARGDSLCDKALQQYGAHTAFYAATRLMLIRVWEDLGLIEPMLYDGGFDEQMTRFNGIITEVVEYSFSRAKRKYKPLFDHSNAYTWFEPDEDTYKDVIYELANTYFGSIESDILGRVYERLLERIDRKLLGIYYTPRDIISLIWDLIDLDSVATEAEALGRLPRVLDIATGSGGFLVEAALRLRTRHASHLSSGASVDTQAWLNDAVDGLNGIEYQHFAAYLAELNMLVQLGQIMRLRPDSKIPSIGIIHGDTLSFHEPDTVLTLDVGHEASITPNSAERLERTERLRSVHEHDFEMDVACGNPPYIGEKLAAPLLRATRRNYPYWEQFVGAHMDYLYWFLILGVSKLRPGGRFGFITTEYWLRADGAKPLRAYLAANAQVERIILLRDFRPFPDAPGHHSLIVIGTKNGGSNPAPASTPRISIYTGPNIFDSRVRRGVLDAIRLGRNGAGVQSFKSLQFPAKLGRESWTEVILTQKQLRTRTRLTKSKQLGVKISKGVETTVNNLTAESRDLLSVANAQKVALRQGIQLLTAKEVAGLGQLNDAEQKVVRRVINTKDVYPYACVIPDGATSVIYLSRSVRADSATSTETVVKTTPFPSGLPAVEAYLSQFRAVLEAKTMDRNERRPWWTLHRPRPDVVGDSSAGADGWSHFCLTSRWGSGGQLVVGLAPTNISPASGLHVMRPSDDTVPAAYLAGLYNSALYQEAALSLPPGQLRQDDLQRLGLPDIGDGVKGVAKRAADLADLVTTMVTETSTLFPALGDALRADVSLAATPSEEWVPSRRQAGHWGELRNVAWVRDVVAKRSARTQLGKVRVVHDLFGLALEIDAHNADTLAATILLDSNDEQLAAACSALLGGAIRSGLTVGDLGSVLVTTSADQLQSELQIDITELNARCSKYRDLRAEIEAILEGN